MTKQLQECIDSGQVSAAQVVAHQEAGELLGKPPRHWVYKERSYDQRAKAIIAFNTCTGDLDDKLDAAWCAALTATQEQKS